MTSQEREILLPAIELIKQKVAESGRFNIKGFGTFKMVTQKARTVKVPKTGEIVEVAECTKLKFTASK